ncbi:hypothetical protein CLIB1444_22S00848 [[Candida] jaroonii]|uniref:Uncharacterized protein n=1 Tax=[Candida] jaroonii TaxID=467808 RepID=A0ACA9YFP5_9ASCO|nr:hypothetical protein CLIB1444_22S00848 [[Candida] jaroonii]
MENSQNNKQRPLVIGVRDPQLDETGENQVGNELRPQRANFHRNVGEGPQVSIPQAVRNPANKRLGNMIIDAPSDEEPQVHNVDLQTDLLRVFTMMILLAAMFSFWCSILLLSNPSTRKPRRSGSEADNNANNLSLTRQIPATEIQSNPELDGNLDISANVASRANPGEELNVVSQPQNVPSDTRFITGGDESGMLSDPAASRQGVEGVNTEILVNGEVLNSVENRARDLSEIKGSQLDGTTRSLKRVRIIFQKQPPLHELGNEDVNPPVLSNQQVSQINQQLTHRFNVETGSGSCIPKNPVSLPPQPANKPQTIDVPRSVNLPQISSLVLCPELKEILKRYLLAKKQLIQVTKKQIQAAEERSLREELEIEEQLKNLDKVN